MISSCNASIMPNQCLVRLLQFLTILHIFCCKWYELIKPRRLLACNCLTWRMSMLGLGVIWEHRTQEKTCAGWCKTVGILERRSATMRALRKKTLSLTSGSFWRWWLYPISVVQMTKTIDDNLYGKSLFLDFIKWRELNDLGWVQFMVPTCLTTN